MANKLQHGDALLIVDPQNDFIPGGTLAVPQGDEVIPILNEWITAAQKIGIPIFVSRDWHPVNHISFKAQGGPWPLHCVKNTAGAAFHRQLQLPENSIIINKAFHENHEAYSAFEGVTQDFKSLAEKLRELNVQRIWIGGLALDYCVYHSAKGAHQAGFAYHVILPACRAIAEESAQKAVDDLQKLQAIFEYDADPYK